MLTPAVTSRVEQRHEPTGATVESLGSVTLQQIAAPAGKGKIVWVSRATMCARNDVLDLEERLADQVLITATILATSISTSFDKVT